MVQHGENKIVNRMVLLTFHSDKRASVSCDELFRDEEDCANLSTPTTKVDEVVAHGSAVTNELCCIVEGVQNSLDDQQDLPKRERFHEVDVFIRGLGSDRKLDCRYRINEILRKSSEQLFID